MANAFHSSPQYYSTPALQDVAVEPVAAQVARPRRPIVACTKPLLHSTTGSHATCLVFWSRLETETETKRSRVEAQAVAETRVSLSHGLRKSKRKSSLEGQYLKAVLEVCWS